MSTKIGVTMLQAIEEDRLDKLPQGLFVRAFVREYARFLGLDEQKVLTDLSFHLGQRQPVEPETPDDAKARSERFAARLVNGGLVASAIAIVAALILVPGISRRNSAAPQLPPVDLATSAEPAAQANSLQASPAPSVLPQPLQLTLTATEDCWIGLDVGGDRVENRVLKKGESFSISARQNASLAVGNAGGLLVAIDSGPARPLGNRGEVKRNIPLSPEAISALSVEPNTPPAKPIG